MPLPFAVSRVGNIYLFFKGSLCIGPDFISLLLTLTLIFTGSLLFLIYASVLAARVVCSGFALISLGLICRCASMDPGVCPRAPPPPPDAAVHEPISESIVYTDRAGQERRAVVLRKWCYQCHNYCPVRASHCHSCDVCVARRDHHCPWAGTCVGERNYCYYFAFLWATLCLAFTVVIGGALSIHRRAGAIVQRPLSGERSPYFEALRETHFIEPIVMIVALIACVLVAPLAVYHLCIAASNMTTREEMRGGDHYYDKGTYWRNAMAALCAQTPPSRLWVSGEGDAARQCMDVVVIADDVDDAEP